MSRDRRHDFPELPAVETLRDALYDARGVTLDVLRLDRLHPLWGGNKVFKLLPNLHRAEALGLRRVISFGGAYSNHLHALAAWGAEHGVQTVGIVRGEAPARPGPTLRVAGSGAYVLGVAALRDAAGITACAAAHLAPTVRRFRVLERFAGRGFARIDAELAAFMARFTQRSGVPLDPVYTGKLFLGLHALVGEGRFPPGTRVLALHTGGLQGAREASCGRILPAAGAVPL